MESLTVYYIIGEDNGNEAEYAVIATNLASAVAFLTLEGIDVYGATGERPLKTPMVAGSRLLRFSFDKED